MTHLVTIAGYSRPVLYHQLKYHSQFVDDIYVGVHYESGGDKLASFVREISKDLDVEVHIKNVSSIKPFDWASVTNALNSIKQQLPNDWWLVADDDELVVFPYQISKVISDAEKMKCNYVCGAHLDRVSEDLRSIDFDTDLTSAFSYAGYCGFLIGRQCPHKVVLCKGNVPLVAGQHFIYDESKSTKRVAGNDPLRFPISKVFAQVHHFKWDQDCISRVKKIGEAPDHYAFSYFYREVYEYLVSHGSKIDLSDPMFLFENISSLNFNDYSHWQLLKDHHFFEGEWSHRFRW